VLRHLDLLDEQLHDRAAVLPSAALEPLAKLFLQLLEFIDDLALVQRLALSVLPLGETRFTVLLALFKAVSSSPQLVEGDGSGLVGIHEPADLALDRLRPSREAAALAIVRLQQRANLGALSFELGRKLLRLLEPSFQVLPNSLFDILGA